MLTRFKQSKLFFWTAEIVLTIIGIYFLLQMPNIFKPVIGFFLSFIVIAFVITLVLMNAVPKMIEQTVQLTQNLPIYAEETGRWLNELANKEEFKNFHLGE